MKYSAFLAAAIITMAGSVAYAAGMMSAHPTIYTPTTIKWMPGTGDLKGLQVAALDGDPSKAGAWTVRIKVPGGTNLPAHYHNDTERLTVISGSFWVAVGMKFDASKLMALPAGSYCVIPAGVWHYAATKTETVIQVSGSSPFAMKMK